MGLFKNSDIVRCQVEKPHLTRNTDALVQECGCKEKNRRTIKINCFENFFLLLFFAALKIRVRRPAISVLAGVVLLRHAFRVVHTFRVVVFTRWNRTLTVVESLTAFCQPDHLLSEALVVVGPACQTDVPGVAKRIFQLAYEVLVGRVGLNAAASCIVPRGESLVPEERVGVAGVLRATDDFPYRYEAV